MYKKIVVAYSGGLDTSVMVKWLTQNYNAEIITVTGNLGQKSELEGLEEKAKKTGAVKSFIYDLQDDFIKDYAFKALKAGALYEGQYPMATAIGRPLLAKMMVDVALREGADTVAHGCTGKGNDQVRFELGFKSLAPELNILAPLREWEFKSREAEIDYAVEHNIPIKISKEKPYSIDENLWGIATECGVLEDPTQVPPDDAYQITTDPKKAPDQMEVIEIEFAEGIPVSVNGKKLSPVGIISALNEAGAKHGVGRMDMIENRVVGIKSREIYEAPGAVLLHKAHHEMEKLVLDKDTFRYKQSVSNQVANMIYDGLWFTPLFDSLMAFVDQSQKPVTGKIKLGMYKGGLTVISRESPFSLYNEQLATYTDEDTFNHKDSSGFINIYGLPYKTLSEVYSSKK